MTTTKSTTLGEILYWTGFVKLYDDGTTSDVGLYAEVRHPGPLWAPPELVDYTRRSCTYPDLDVTAPGELPGSRTVKGLPDRHLRIAYAGPDPQQVLDALAARVDQERAKT